MSVVADLIGGLPCCLRSVNVKSDDPGELMLIKSIIDIHSVSVDCPFLTDKENKAQPSLRRKARLLLVI